MAVDPSGHVFISYSSRDQIKAKLICDRLEAAGFRGWISMRDVDPGSNYQASIVQAIQDATMMVLVFSENTNLSQEVHKEMSLASAFKVIVMPVRIADVQPSGALLYELATRQWIDAVADWDAAMERLVATARAHRNGPPPLASSLAESVAPFALVKAAPNPTAVPTTAFSKDQIDAARTALTFYLGPIADVLVRKASAKATSLAELHDRLAAHIQSADAQTAFRKRLSLRH